jgi:hypothetical protein
VKLNSTQQYAVVLVVLLLAAVFAYFALNQERPADRSVFLSNLASADEVAIVMDLRGATSQQRDRIMQCGVDLAGSEGLAAKNVSAYALEDDKCTSSKGERAVSECEAEFTGKVRFVLTKGDNNSTFYEKRLLITMNESWNSTCGVSVKQ